MVGESLNCGHTILNLKCKDCRKLQKDAYDRLKAQGFEDAEDTSHPHQPLKRWHNLKWKELSHDKLSSTQDYYLQARSLLLTYSFKNSTQKTIWELHSEGLSKRKIESLISNHIPSYRRESIGVIIKVIAAQIKNHGK